MGLHDSSPPVSLFFLKSMNKSGSFLFMAECRALFSATLNAASAFPVTDARFTLTQRFSPLVSVPSPGQLSQRVQSVGNFPTTSRHPLKATAYVSPTVQQGPTSPSLTSSVSLHSIPSSASLPQPLKTSSSLVPQPLKSSSVQSAAPRSSLPRPASFVGTGGVLRASKITQPTRRWGQNYRRGISCSCFKLLRMQSGTLHFVCCHFQIRYLC